MHDDLAILHALLYTLSEDRHPEDALRQSISKTADLTGWPGVTLLEPSGPGEDDSLTVIASAGRLSLPIGTCISKHTLPWEPLERAATLEYVPDTALRPSFPSIPNIRSMIYMPLTPCKSSCAMLLLASDHRDGFDNHDLVLAETLRTAFVPAYQHVRATIEKDNYLRTWMASSNDGIILLDSELHVSLLNQQSLNYLNLPGCIEDWQHRSIWDLFKQMRMDAPDIVQQIIADDQSEQTDDDCLREGEYRLDLQTIHWYDFPVHDQQHHLGRILILRNVTDIRLLRKIRKSFTETIRSDIQAPLERLATALSSIAPGGNAQHLHQENGSIVDNALTTARTTLATVKELVDINQLESGKTPLSPSAFSFPDLVESVVQKEQPLAEERHLKLVKLVDQSLPLTWGDHRLIQQVLQQIVDNALKVASPGGSVQVAAEVMPQYADKIRVSVSDRNQSNLHLNRDHNMLYTYKAPQAHESEELWLAFCRSVLRAHGERLWVSCPDTHGITVTFTLPRVLESLTQLKTFS